MSGSHRRAAREPIPPADALALARCTDLEPLFEAAAAIRDDGFGDVITYSRKVFVPLTKLCRDTCRYCTFAHPPRTGEAPYLPIDAVLEIARRGASAGCTEALFTLGDKPELRYRAARDALAALGHGTTLDYLRDVAEQVFLRTGLIPHLNPGVMTRADLARLRPVGGSMGLMLETASERLSEKGGPHHGSPDKHPAVRLETIRLAGELAIPFTTGLLIGIGETRRERIEALLAIRSLHERHGHIQEVIIQNFKSKQDTGMARVPDATFEDHLWTIAVARLVLGGGISIQAPPNLAQGALSRLVAAGIDDWGGVSPVTPDHVNPEAPWPEIDDLAEATAAAGKHLVQRLPIYPSHLQDARRWLDPALRTAVLHAVDATGLVRNETWAAGAALPFPPRARVMGDPAAPAVGRSLSRVLERAQGGRALSAPDIVALFCARGVDALAVYRAADELRADVNGDTVSYAVNRNINYTNVCTYKCQFCAFSKGRGATSRRGAAYHLGLDEIVRRAEEAWARGATEVCLQGGIHPDFDGDTYLDICRAIKVAVPDIHVHAFSPLEVWHGATSLGLSVTDYLVRLREAGLASLPGTAAEILHDDVRRVLCADKIGAGTWLEVMACAHRVGLRSTATIMFGHVDDPSHWAHHLLAVRDLQARTGGFTEFVPLPFVHMEAPLYLKGFARRGPTSREALLMHAVSRLALHPHVENIQVSWVKLGVAGAKQALRCGANDLGGTLMNETISRAAGAAHGQEMASREMAEAILSLGRRPRQRTTLYGDVSAERADAATTAPVLLPVVNDPYVPNRHARGADRRSVA